jgi:mRNA-degrading endonuclease RelE of RelBE toxin-antitoxin system
MSSRRQCEKIYIDYGVRIIMLQLPKEWRNRVDRRILALAEDPRPPDSRELIGHHNVYYVTEGTWRIVYFVENGTLGILALEGV